MDDLQYIAEVLPGWYAENARVLPWREDKEPYHVWLSEIMLQQTRVEAVKDYYRRFLQALPTLKALADVSDEKLMKLWEGLGYYSRARNLKKAAIQIEEKYGGVFPVGYDDILYLPGIGPYTAGAIASICFDQPTPAVDGNVLRVYTRLTAFDGNIDTDAVKKQVREALLPLYTPGKCGVLTQSLMELGACVCIPNGSPKCGVCPLNTYCLANAKGAQTAFPVKSEKKQRKKIDKIVLILKCGDRYAIQKRKSTGLLAGLWEFPNIDTEKSLSAAIDLASSLGAAPKQVLMQSSYTHVFTHVEWHMTGFFIECANKPERFTWATPEEMQTVYALPSAFRPFFDKIASTEEK